jgi:hypothetical protein
MEIIFSIFFTVPYKFTSFYANFQFPSLAGVKLLKSTVYLQNSDIYHIKIEYKDKIQINLQKWFVKLHFTKDLSIIWYTHFFQYIESDIV